MWVLTGPELPSGERDPIHWLCADSLPSPDGQYVAAGSSDGTLFIWETFSGKVKTRKEHGKEIVTCMWHPKGQLFASADRNKKVILWKR
jgi:WD40 repeat protein